MKYSNGVFNCNKNIVQSLGYGLDDPGFESHRYKRFFSSPDFHTGSGPQLASSSIDPRVEICAFLGFYAAQIGSLLPMFRDNLSVPSSRAKLS
jgi:hypothetical protein